MNPQTLTTAQLIEAYRDALLRLDPKDRAAVRRADLLEEEILRRMAW